MKHNHFFVLIACAMILVSMVSCKKETFDYKPDDGQNHTVNPGKTNSLTTSCTNWVAVGNGKFSDRLDGILTQINTPPSGSNGISIYLVEQGRDLPINSGFKYRLGVVWAEINKNDVTVFYQSDDRTDNLPFTSLNIKIVSQ